MGFFSRLKQGVSSKANQALDNAIEPSKELDLAILELEDGRKKALAELVTYKATAKQMDDELARNQAKIEEWEKRAMIAVKAGDDDAAKLALREKRNLEVEQKKLQADRNEAQGYALSLNKSRKEFETKLTMLKLRKNTLATQIAAGRAKNGDVFGNDASVWDKFAEAEQRIDDEAIASEVDAAMRGEADGSLLDAKFAKLAAGQSASQEVSQAALPSGDPLAELKAKVAAERANRAKALAAATPEGEAAAKQAQDQEKPK